MNNTCSRCAGEGIIGAGEFPLAKQGPLSQCPDCAGTGKITASEESPAEEVASTNPEASASDESFLDDSGDSSPEATEAPAEESPAEIPAEAPVETAEAAPEEILA